MTSELQQTRYDRLVRRVGGIIGPGSKVSEALAELFPVIDVERVPGELLRLGGTFLAFGGISVAAGAGVAARAQLFNPVGSGNIIAVSHVDVATQTTDILRYGVNNIAIATGVGTQLHRDLRTPITTLPVGEIRTQTSVALAPATGQIRILANVMWRLEDVNSVVILPPGSGLQIGASANNTTIFATFFWREREALDSELNI